MRKIMEPANQSGCARLSRRKGARSQRGMAMVEAVLLLPLLLLLLLNVVNFGIYIYASITVANAARTAAEYRIYNGVVVAFPATPAFSQVQTLVNNDVSSLPNYSASVNPTLKICSSSNGTVTCSGSGSYTPPADPEPTLYAIYSADVAYTFTPV